MPMYPFNPFMGQVIQTDLKGIRADAMYGAHLTWEAPAQAAAAAVLAATALANGATTEITVGITNPDVPRVLSVTGNAATAVGNVVISGTDIAGNAITDTILAAGAATVAGTKAFKTITKITLPVRGAAGDKISVGTTDALGMPYRLPTNTVMMAAFGGVRETDAPEVTVSAVDLATNTVKLDTALDGASNVDAYLVV